MSTTLKRLQERDAAEWRIDERFDHYQNALTDIIEKASRRAVEYACRFEMLVLVLEDLSYVREDLDYGEWMNRRLHAGRSLVCRSASRTKHERPGLR
jgi:putative transposase